MFNITGSVGISVNPLMSKIASKLQKPDGMVILEQHEISRVLAKLPVEKIPGIAGCLSRRLHGLSIFSFAEIKKQ
ncbi:MAG: hypothetical protein KJ893_02755 [Candidatus Omnitrophica bacterium]|nr:hypothetical protein [Candidatus Omnitrophota bacterium]MBU4478665.1 hypothetical protein [Candidatus Omnitrophota bacterium]